MNIVKPVLDRSRNRSEIPVFIFPLHFVLLTDVQFRLYKGTQSVQPDPLVPFAVPAVEMDPIGTPALSPVDDFGRVPLTVGVARVQDITDLVWTRNARNDFAARRSWPDDEIFLERGR